MRQEHDALQRSIAAERKETEAKEALRKEREICKVPRFALCCC